MNDNVFTIERDKSRGTPIATEMPCGHIFWGNPPKDCSVCAQIKAAEKAAREGVFNLAKRIMTYPLSYEIDRRWEAFVKAFDEEFGP